LPATILATDAATNSNDVLMRAEQFEKQEAVANVENIEAMYPLLADVEPDDWEDISHYDKTSS
jgi:hypothetical protein